MCFFFFLVERQRQRERESGWVRELVSYPRVLFASRAWGLGDEKLDRFGNEKFDGLGCDVRGRRVREKRR